MLSEDKLRAAALEYVAWDPCPETQATISELLHSNDYPGLTSLLGKRQSFGTAGLRGPMCAGYAGLNYLVVLQTTQGLIRYLQNVLGKETAASQGLVIGYDHRRLGAMNSRGFAELCAKIFTAAKFKVYLYEDIVATPMVPFGVKKLNTAAGIMITASHNPKQDNGYKLYWGNGVQIIPPHDMGIYSTILENLAPWRDYSTVAIPELRIGPENETLREYIAKVYLLELRDSILNSERSVIHRSTRKIAYTAMHGVGEEWIRRAFKEFELSNQLKIVPSQSLPDPEFPTVVFPNPEEKGALDVSIAFANENFCDVIIANDPDADRLGAAEKLADGNWKVFSGNEIGVMMGHFQIMKHKTLNASSAAVAELLPRQPAVLASIVSSRMLQTVAKAEGVMYADTLTGFKWLGNESLRLQCENNAIVLFAYEEALGYCVGGVVHDKDGISGAVSFVEMVNYLQMTRSMSLNDYLESIYAQYGQFQSNNSYVICHDPIVIKNIFERLRTCGSTPALNGYFDSCGDIKVLSIRDITNGLDINTDAGTPPLPATPGSEMVMFHFENNCTVTLRTSGTEPKIKYYIEMGGLPGQTKAEVRVALMSFSEQVVSSLLQPEKNRFG